MNLQQAQSNLETELSNLTGVSNWQSTSFGILPNEGPKGYLQLESVSNTNLSLSRVRFLGGIAVSGASLSALNTRVFDLVEALVSGFRNSQGCLGGTRFRIISPINVEIPQTYSQQNNVSSISGYFTAITFALEGDSN